MRGLHRVSSLHFAAVTCTPRYLELPRSAWKQRAVGQRERDVGSDEPENVIHRFGDTRFPRSSALR